jgi:hypothetical protein
VVDVARQRVLDAAVERCNHGLADRLETVLQVERRERGLQQRGEHVAVPRQALELLRRRDLLAALRQSLPEPELARDHRA